MRIRILILSLGLVFASCSGVPPCPPAGLDGDRDCVADSIDKCANALETMNQYKDEDGCPDNVPVPLAKNVLMRLESVTFQPGTADLAGFSHAILDQMAESMQRFPYMQIEIACFEDDTRLALRRAQAIKSYLEGLSIPSSRMQAVGLPLPVGPNPRTEPSLRRID